MDLYDCEQCGVPFSDKTVAYWAFNTTDDEPIATRALDHHGYVDVMYVLNGKPLFFMTYAPKKWTSDAVQEWKIISEPRFDARVPVGVERTMHSGDYERIAARLKSVNLSRFL